MKSDEEKNREANPAPDVKVHGSLSRREWFLRVGGAALAAGLPSFPGEALPAALEDENAHPAVALPPGLYSPSGECLGRALESDALFHPVPPGSQTDYVKPLAGAFRPAFFSEDEFQTIRRCVELFLGLEDDSTGSAGHKQEAEAVSQWIDLRVASAAGIREAARALSPAHRAVAVAYYGDAAAVHHLETDAPEPVCWEGLAWLDRESERKHGAKFLALNEVEQIEIMKTMSDDQPSAVSEDAGAQFFKFLKDEAIRGYYTSRTGLKELDYQGNKFHATSPGCNLPVKTG